MEFCGKKSHASEPWLGTCKDAPRTGMVGHMLYLHLTQQLLYIPCIRFLNSDVHHVWSIPWEYMSSTTHSLSSLFKIRIKEVSNSVMSFEF